MSEELKSGNTTSEHAETKTTGIIGIIAAIAGLIVASGPQILEVSPETGSAAVVIGGIITVAGLIAKTLSGMGYTNSRTQIKVAVEARKAAEAKATLRQGGLSG